MKLIYLFSFLILATSANAMAAQAPNCADGQYLLGVPAASLQSVAEGLSAAQSAGQLTILSTSNSGGLVMISVKTNGTFAQGAIDAVAATPGAIVECNEVIDPGF